MAIAILVTIYNFIIIITEKIDVIIYNHDCYIIDKYICIVETPD